MTINETVKKLRVNKGMTQIDLASKLNCNRQKVADWERGKATPSASDLILLSKIFEVSSDYLLGLTAAATTDKDVQYICDYTGLSEDAVDTLHSCIKIMDEEAYKLSVDFVSDLLESAKTGFDGEDIPFSDEELKRLKKYSEDKEDILRLFKFMVKRSVHLKKYLFVLNKLIPDDNFYCISRYLTQCLDSNERIKNINIDYKEDFSDLKLDESELSQKMYEIKEMRIQNEKEFQEYQLFKISKQLFDILESSTDEYIAFKKENNINYDFDSSSTSMNFDLPF